MTDHHDTTAPGGAHSGVATLDRDGHAGYGIDLDPWPEPPAAVWWDIYADDLARWAWDRLVNRTDVWGGYTALSDRGRTFTRRDRRTGNLVTGEVGQTVTHHASDIVGCAERGPLTLTHLHNHFRAPWLWDLLWDDPDRLPRWLIWLHAIAPDNTCKWCSADIDYHGEGSTAPALNRRAAEGWYETAATWGFRPLLWSSNGRGGYKLVLLFAHPVPSPVAYELARSLVSDYRAYGFPAAPETFPKQPLIGQDGRCPYGNGDRLIGRHHTRPHLAEVYDGRRWLEGQEAVEHVLSLTGDDPALIPRHVVVAAERHTAPPPPPNPPLEKRPAPRHRPETPDGGTPAEPAAGQTPVPDAVAEAIEDYMARQDNLGEGQGRHGIAFRCAAYLLRDMGRPWAEALGRLEEWDAGNSPPLGRGELEKIARDAERYGRKPRGCGLERLRAADGGGDGASMAPRWTDNKDVQEIVDMLAREDAREQRVIAMRTPEQWAELEARERAIDGARALWAEVRAAEGQLWHAWRSAGRRRARDCGNDKDHEFERVGNPHDRFVGFLPCGRLCCDYCRVRIRARWAREIAQAILERTPDGIEKAPNGEPRHVTDGKTPPKELPRTLWRTAPVYVWTGPAGKWDAVRQAIRRAWVKTAGGWTGGGEDPRWGAGYTRVLIADDFVFVVADLPFRAAGKDAEAAEPAEAARQALRHIVAAPAVRGFVSRSRAWIPTKRKEWIDNGGLNEEVYYKATQEQREAEADERMAQYLLILESAGATVEVLLGARHGAACGRRVKYATPETWGRDEHDNLLWHLRRGKVPETDMATFTRLRGRMSQHSYTGAGRARKKSCDTAAAGASQPAAPGDCGPPEGFTVDFG